MTVAALSMVEQAEAHVRSLGFRVFRVRHLVEKERTTARVQIAPGELRHLPAVAGVLEAGLRAAGYAAVEIDPAGYRAPA